MRSSTAHPKNDLVEDIRSHNPANFRCLSPITIRVTVEPFPGGSMIEARCRSNGARVVRDPSPESSGSRSSLTLHQTTPHTSPDHTPSVPEISNHLPSTISSLRDTNTVLLCTRRHLASRDSRNRFSVLGRTTRDQSTSVMHLANSLIVRSWIACRLCMHVCLTP